MASAGSTSVTSTTMIYSSVVGCAVFNVKCRAASAHTTWVNVDGVHVSGDWYHLDAGESAMFRKGFAGIHTVTVRGEGGTSSIYYGVVAVEPASSPDYKAYK